MGSLKKNNLLTSMCKINTVNIIANRHACGYFAMLVAKIVFIYKYICVCGNKFILSTLQCLYFFIHRHELHVIMDEIYMLSVYDDTTFTSVLSLDR